MNKFFNHISFKKCCFYNIIYFLFVLSTNPVFSQITNYSKSVSFNENNTNSLNNNTYTNQNTNPQIFAPPKTTAQDIINQSHQNVPMYGTGTNQQKNQDIIHAYIMNNIKNDPMYQLPQQLSPRDAHINLYKLTFYELLKMQKGEIPFSLKRAVILIENAYSKNQFSYKEYQDLINEKINLLKKLMTSEKITENNQLGKNYLIQKLFSENIIEYNGNEKRIHKPYRYDFEDFLGEENWSSMFVYKLLKTGKGQCHSMPLLYLIFAEELKTKAWLSLAPEHSFIIFKSGRTFYNFETTNGKLVSEEWLIESGYINTTAIKNRIYLDTLGKNELMGVLLADLIMGYTNLFGYDNFMNTMVNSLLGIYPKSIQGHIFKANLLTLQTKNKLKKVGYPPVEKINEYPEAYHSYQAMLKQYDYIDDLGYMQIPKDKYANWLNSLNQEKHKQENQKLKTAVIQNTKNENE